MDNELPKISLVQLYGIEYDATLRQATETLVRTREWIDSLTIPHFRNKAKVEMATASKIITNIATAIRQEIARIDSEWWIYDDLEDVRSYRLFLNHLVDRSLYNNTEKDRLMPAERKETACPTP